MAQLKDLIVNGASRFIGDIFGNNATLNGDLMPTSNNTQSLGDSTHQWKLYGTITGSLDKDWKIKINNTQSTYDGSTAVDAGDIYAPTAGGAAGKVLIGAGTTTAPAWYSGLTLTGVGTTDSPYAAAFDGSVTLTGTDATTAKLTFSRAGTINYIVLPADDKTTLGFVFNSTLSTSNSTLVIDKTAAFPGTDKGFDLGNINYNNNSTKKRWNNVYADSYHSQVAAASTSGISGFLLEDISGNMYGNLYLVTAGTTSKDGLSGLTLGNKIASGTAANARGSIYLYGTSTTYTALQSALTGSTNSTMYLPNHAGTGYLTHVAGTTAVGSTSQPVYVAANGRIEAITGAIGNDTTGNAATATAADITTTANAVAYYSNTTGTFASKPSAQGALYATAENGALTFGTLPVAEGGTGVKSFTANRVVMSGSSTTAALTTRAVVNNTSSKAAATNAYIVTQNTLYNSQALINGAAQQRNVEIYAPTSAGTAGQVLVSSGSGAPTWGNNYELIWENSNHANDFSSQTITLPSGTLSYGDLLLIILGSGVTNGVTFIEASPLIYLYSSAYGNVIYNPTYIEYSGGNTGYYMRTINIDVTNNTIDFTGGTYIKSGSSGITANDHMIPHYIFKIRR